MAIRSGPIMKLLVQYIERTDRGTVVTGFLPNTAMLICRTALRRGELAVQSSLHGAENKVRRRIDI